MGDKKFDILFTGKLVEGAAIDQVKANVAKLFKTDVAKIERLFIGMPVMIKKGVDEETALKYMMALKKAGTICEAREQAAAAPAAPPPAAPAAQPLPATSSQPMPNAAPAPASTAPAPASEAGSKSEIEIAAGEEGDTRFVIKDAPQGLGELADASLDPPGTQIVEHQDVPPPQIDTTGMSLDQSEADLVEHEEPPPLNVDLSGMTLDEPGARIGEEEEVPELEVDLSGMTLDEPGVTLVEPEEPKEPKIDTSHLKLSGD
jgi:hypothetical protein